MVVNLEVFAWTIFDTLFRPKEITCGPEGWSHESASCDATNGSLPPGAQIALIVVVLGLLCGGTFAWQKYKQRQAPAEDPGNFAMTHFK